MSLFDLNAVITVDPADIERLVSLAKALGAEFALRPFVESGGVHFCERCEAAISGNEFGKQLGAYVFDCFYRAGVKQLLPTVKFSMAGHEIVIKEKSERDVSLSA